VIKNLVRGIIVLTIVLSLGIMVYQFNMPINDKTIGGNLSATDKLSISNIVEYPSNVTMNKTVDIAIFKRKWLDVAYASKSETQKMDIFLPNEGKGPFPVIILIHGGFYKTGDKKDERDYMIEILNRGYAAASINYRLIDEATFPAQIYDVKAAIRYVRANASKYNINSNKIATWGTSAGGHLSALAGTSGDVPELDNLELGNANQSTKIQAAVDWFGPINFLTMDDQFRESGVDGQVHNVATSSESLLIGKQINLAKDLVQKANPETYITADDPPIYIQHGTNDIIVPIQQSMEFSNNLVKYIGSNKLVYESLKGASHGDPAFRRKENVDRILDFIDKYLK